MSFRDDRDAMLARLTVLERQAHDAGELRERVETLEVENHRLRAEVAVLRARLAPPAPPPLPTAVTGGVRALSFAVRDGAGERIENLQLEVIKIGKLSSTHLRLADEGASRMHAVIENNETEVVIVDLGSATGTRVNGHKVNKQALSDGDEIRISDSVLVVRIPGA